MSLYHSLKTPISLVIFSLVLTACGGGSESTSTPSANNVPYVMPERYSESAYSSFVSSNNITNLEGTWIVLMRGKLKRAYSPVVNGRNDATDYQYFARALLRLKKPDPLVNEYLTYTCGPGGARDYKSISNGSTILIPFYYYSTGSWSSYPMDILNETNLSNDNVSRALNFVGNNGLTMSYDLSFKIKKISDNPFEMVSNTFDVPTDITTENGCFYEAEGNYVATQDDKFVQGFRKVGTFYSANAYPASELINDIGSYSRIYGVNDFSSYYTSFSRYSGTQGSIALYETYHTSNNDIVQSKRTITGNSVTYTLNASENLNLNQSANIILSINLN